MRTSRSAASQFRAQPYRSRRLAETQAYESGVAKWSTAKHAGYGRATRAKRKLLLWKIAFRPPHEQRARTSSRCASGARRTLRGDPTSHPLLATGREPLAIDAAAPRHLENLNAIRPPARSDCGRMGLWRYRFPSGDPVRVLFRRPGEQKYGLVSPQFPHTNCPLAAPLTAIFPAGQSG